MYAGRRRRPKGNVNAISDAGSAVHLGYSSMNAASSQCASMPKRQLIVRRRKPGCKEIHGLETRAADIVRQVRHTLKSRSVLATEKMTNANVNAKMAKLRAFVIGHFTFVISRFAFVICQLSLIDFRLCDASPGESVTPSPRPTIDRVWGCGRPPPSTNRRPTHLHRHAQADLLTLPIPQKSPTQLSRPSESFCGDL